MKVYLVYSHSYEHLLLECGARILVNYARPSQSKLGRVIPNGFSSILVDSGVFQLQMGRADTSQINVGGYTTWLQFELPRHLEVDGYFAYDWGATEKELKDNYKYMLSAGLSPIPVWHPRVEGVGTLDYYASRTDYIGIGGIVVSGHLKAAAPMLAKSLLRYPSHRFHMMGLGHSQLSLLSNLVHPYSLDVSTWMVPAIYGHLLVNLEDGRIVERHLTGNNSIPAEALMGGKENKFLMDSLRSSIRALMNMEKFEFPERSVQPWLL